ncbi:ribosome silencing factor [bacterium]|nr:ribosome silencing factor [candidate division CSSED10-310 bacterium]
MLREKKAESIIGFDLRKLDGVIIDGFLICSGLSERQVAAITENVRIRLKEMGEGVRHVEGELLNQWVLIDSDDIVIHIFLDKVRSFYRLENLWTHATVMQFESAAIPETSDLV